MSPQARAVLLKEWSKNWVPSLQVQVSMEIERKGFHTHFTEEFNMCVEPINNNEKLGIGFLFLI